MLRLKLPRTTPGIQVWDTPTPLDLYHCTLHRADIGDSMQFRTIELRKATGITFFFSFRQVYDIHFHTTTTPSASKTFKRLSRRRQPAVTWIYLPISRNDRIIAFGVGLEASGSYLRGGPQFLISLSSQLVLPFV